MALYHLTDRNAQFAFDRALTPALFIEPGDTVAFTTEMAILRRLEAGEPIEQLNLEEANAVLGPVHVNGAEPGDALRLTIERIDIDAAWAA